MTETRVVRVLRLLDKNKAKAAFLAPLLTACGVAVANWVVTGAFDATEIRAAAGGAVLAAVSGVATYLRSSGTAVVSEANVTSLTPPA